MAPSSWLAPITSDTGHGPVLLCIPYAGGGATVFRGWKRLAGLASVIAVRTPGREGRVGETPLSSVAAIVDGLLPAVAPLASRPLVLFGHSLGASVAFELARALRRHRLPQPRALVVSGRRAPHIPPRDEPIAGLPRAAFLEEMRDMAGTPPEFFAHEELVELMLPTLRADFAAAEQYLATPEPPLSLPIVAYGGTEDDEPTPAELTAWAHQTTGAFSSHVFSGDHFFLKQEDTFLPVLEADLRRLTSP